MRFILVALLLAACASPSPTPTPTTATRTIHGTLELVGRAAAAVEDVCYGYEGYDDIKTGTQVTVADQGGTLIGTGSLGRGVLNEDRTRCTFPFIIHGLPDATFYAIEVSRRGELTYSAAEMEQMDWRVAFTLGD